METDGDGMVLNLVESGNPLPADAQVAEAPLVEMAPPAVLDQVATAEAANSQLLDLLFLRLLHLLFQMAKASIQTTAHNVLDQTINLKDRACVMVISFYPTTLGMDTPLPGLGNSA